MPAPSQQSRSRGPSQDISNLMDQWPNSWAGDDEDKPFGQGLVAEFQPFIVNLQTLGLSRKTVRRHLDSLWVIGGEIIRQFADGSWYILKEARTPEGGIALSFIEITELKRVEQDLRKLSQAVEQSPASVVITTAEGNIEYVNPKFA